MQIRGQTQHIQRFLVAATKPLCCAPAELSRAERSRAAGIRFGGAQSQLNLQRARPATSDRWMLALQLRARKRDTVALMQPSRRLYHQQSGSTQWRASEFPQVCQERERESSKLFKFIMIVVAVGTLERVFNFSRSHANGAAAATITMSQIVVVVVASTTSAATQARWPTVW